MADALVVSGGGPYADLWHRFSETSGRLAGIIAGLGHTVEVTDDVEAALGAPACRLLVINIGNPPPSHAGVTSAVSAGLQSHLDGGGALLGIHSSATTLTTLPQWPRILGGRWGNGELSGGLQRSWPRHRLIRQSQPRRPAPARRHLVADPASNALKLSICHLTLTHGAHSSHTGRRPA
jgi:hypothetical protein